MNNDNQDKPTVDGRTDPGKPIVDGQNKIIYGRLPNGLRTVYQPQASQVGYCGLVIMAGSRNEDAGHEGLAHFVEHTIFKGTRNRTAEDIRNRMEAVGGELNAFTGKDDTVVYTVFPAEYAERAIDLIADLTMNSVFPRAELDKEREVVLSEIESYRDTPSEMVYDDFEGEAYRGTPLAHNILGNEAAIRRFGTRDCRNWVSRYYTAARCVLFYSGYYTHARFMSLAERYFGGMNPGDETEAKTDVEPQLELPERSFRRNVPYQSVQVHTVIGKALPRLDWPERFALQLFTNIVGGPGMNALLNVELREKRGLVYTVEAGTSYYRGTALFTVYYGCNPDDDDECLAVTHAVLRRLYEHPLTDAELDAAKQQYLGQLIIANDNNENRVIAIARATLHHGHSLTAESIHRAINELTPQDIAAIAHRLTPASRLSYRPTE